jgi:hypothetical protein
MKNLVEYINESLLDDEEVLVNDETITIKAWLAQNCEIRGQISIVKKGKKYIINSNDNITITNKELVEFPEYIQFGKVRNFYCSDCTLLKSLRGCPTAVINSFSCSGCTSLTSLVGAPTKADSFFCNRCTSLKSLEGCPQKLNYFECCECTSLTSLVGGPKKMGSTTTNKKSPFNAPYRANDCKSLNSIEGLPEYANEIFLERCYGLDKRDIKTHLPKEFRTIHLGYGCIDGDLSTYYKR